MKNGSGRARRIYNGWEFVRREEKAGRGCDAVRWAVGETVVRGEDIFDVILRRRDHYQPVGHRDVFGALRAARGDVLCRMRYSGETRSLPQGIILATEATPLWMAEAGETMASAAAIAALGVAHRWPMPEGMKTFLRSGRGDMDSLHNEAGDLIGALEEEHSELELLRLRMDASICAILSAMEAIEAVAGLGRGTACHDAGGAIMNAVQAASGTTFTACHEVEIPFPRSYVYINHEELAERMACTLFGRETARTEETL
jgi:hypothetical protein